MQPIFVMIKAEPGRVGRPNRERAGVVVVALGVVEPHALAHVAVEHPFDDGVAFVAHAGGVELGGEEVLGASPRGLPLHEGPAVEEVLVGVGAVDDAAVLGLVVAAQDLAQLVTHAAGFEERSEAENGGGAVAVEQVGHEARIADLVHEKKLEGISDLRDESDRRGIRVYIELKRDARPKQVLNNLYKYTALQTTFPVNMVALVDNTPQTCSLKLILEEYIKHRHDVVRRRSVFELKEARAREHILEGLKIAVDHIDEVISIIKKSKDADEANVKLMTKFKLSDIQTTAILDMQLRRLAALERQKIEDELSMVRETIAYLEDLLEHPTKILKVVKDELTKLKEKYGDQRKTRVFKSKRRSTGRSKE